MEKAKINPMLAILAAIVVLVIVVFAVMRRGGPETVGAASGQSAAPPPAAAAQLQRMGIPVPSGSGAAGGQTTPTAPTSGRR